MPIFEFQCQKCHAEFEEVVFGQDMPACPRCGAAQTQKLMSCPCRSRGSAGDGGYGGDDAYAPSTASAGGGKCAGCSGGNCATCH